MLLRKVGGAVALLSVIGTSVNCGDDGGSGGGGVGGGGAGGSSSSGSVSSSPSSSSSSGSSSSGSSSSSSANSSSGSSSGSGCRPKFASGVNVAWFSFANDVPSPAITKFDALYKAISPVGGRVVRWWFHTNGTKTPGYDSTTGLATKITDSQIQDVKAILDQASSDGVSVVVSLWSFDMMKSDQTGATILQHNKDLLQKDANRKAYADNVLTPLVGALKGHPGLYAWEIFNEPEGMINDGPNTTPWTGSNYVSIKDVQACINVFAGAIHTADPSAQVTSSAWTFLANTDVDGHKNYYSDTELKAAGGQANGTLDFYEVHYYDNWGAVGAANSISPFVASHPASYWKLDKPIIIGEFWDIDSPGDSSTTIKAADLYTTLYSAGYKGAWAWQYANADNPGPKSGASTQWPAMQTPMQNLYSAHKADLECK